MNTINIALAGRVIRLQSKYCFSETFYRSFRTEKIADCVVTLREEDISFEKKNSDSMRAVIKQECVLKKVADSLINYDVFLMHGAVISVDGRGILFSAQSGIGKTTHCRLWQDSSLETEVINGDKPFISTFPDDHVPMISGSPWAGKENMYINTMVPLSSIVFLERSVNNYIERIKYRDAFPYILQHIYRPDDENKMKKTLCLIQRLKPSVSFWRFKCNNFKEDCFDVAYKALIGD